LISGAFCAIRTKTSIDTKHNNQTLGGTIGLLRVMQPDGHAMPDLELDRPVRRRCWITAAPASVEVEQEFQAS
jgi:hypothetical protein